MADKTFILKNNSEEIRKKITDSGIRVCICASFKDACWLDYSTVVANGVHGIGYFGEEVEIHSVEEELARFIAECKNPTFCKDVDEFISLIKEFEYEKAE